MSSTDRTTKALLVVIAAGIWILALRGFGDARAQADHETGFRESFDEIDVKRINLVEEDGTTRLVLANTTRFPPPIVDGKEYPRSVPPAGLVFYDRHGNECGGLAVTEAQGGERSHLVFDYQRSEAIGIGCFESDDGSRRDAGITIVDPTPASQSLLAGSVGQPRVSIANSNRNALIELNDPRGRPRLRLQVDAPGEPRIELLDANGKAVAQMPEPVR